MDETGWLECDDWHPRVSFLLEGAVLKRKALERKLRLFGCACCRRMWHLFVNEEQRRAVEIGELFADGQANAANRAAAKKGVGRSSAKEGGLSESMREAAKEVVTAYPNYLNLSAASSVAGAAAFDAQQRSRAEGASEAVHHAAWDRGHATAQAEQCQLLRDIFGNPFHAVASNLASHLPVVLSLAEAAYEDRILPGGTLDPARLAVLADALEDAGCADPAILGHLRGSGPHVRGCWAVDLLLDKR